MYEVNIRVHKRVARVTYVKLSLSRQNANTLRDAGSWYDISLCDEGYEKFVVLVSRWFNKTV